MTTTVVRTLAGWWVLRSESTVAKIDLPSDATTRDLLAHRSAVDSAAASPIVVSLDGLELLSPVTAPCRVVAQMTNYASHVTDAGMDPKSIPLTFFRKTSGSITGPTHNVLKPKHVNFLDYEVEVGLVIGATLKAGNLHEYVAGFVLTNDVSARDLQLPKTQFFEAKSYPTFTPTGPFLVLLDGDELDRFNVIRMTLSVNGEVRQDTVVGPDIMYPPLEALQALSRIQLLEPGDLVLTGTPVGTALSAPPKPVEIIGHLLPVKVKWRLFFKRAASNPKYLKDGDVITAAARTPDGVIDLGTQTNTVRDAR